MFQEGNIRLRAIEREDLPRFVNWLNDPEVRRHLQISLPLSMAQEEIWFENLLKKPMEEHPLVIEIESSGEWVSIGNISFLNINWIDCSTEIGVFIGEKKYWNQGYGRKAMRMMMRHGFLNLHLNRIYLQVYETNPRAIRSYEHAGFTLEGHLRQAKFQDGRFIDILLMSVLRNEWQDNVD